MAASAVLQRVAFVERTKDGYIRFADWALATTRLGVMAEPFPGRGYFGEKGVAFDATDDLALISEIQQINSDMLPTMLSGGGPVLHGGNLMPRDGR